MASVLVRRIAAAAALAALLAGLPAGLVTVVGWPLPTSVPDADTVRSWLSAPLADRAVIDILALLAWFLWAQLVRAVVVEARAVRRGIPARPLRLAAGTQHLAAALITALTVSISVSTMAQAAAGPSGTAVTDRVAAVPPSAAAGPNVAIAGRPAIAETVAAHTVPAQAGGVEALGTITLVVADTHYTYRVVRGDNLSKIAKVWLGDPNRWPEIYALNRGRHWPAVSGQTRLVNPDLILPGWVLDLPTDARPPADATPTEPAPSTDTGPSTAPGASCDSDGVVDPPTAATAEPAPPVPAADPSAPASTTPTTSPAPATSATPSAGSTSTPAPSANQTPGEPSGDVGDATPDGVRLPSSAWISGGLAALIAAMIALLRLQQRRRARLSFPVPVRTGAAPAPVPASLDAADAAGSRLLTANPVSELAAVLPAAPAVPVPVGADADGEEVSLFDLPAALALHGDGATAAARAVLAAALTTGIVEYLFARPIVVTTTATLSRLLPPGAPPVGLDPRHETFDPERLVVTVDTAAAVAHLGQEMDERSRLLDNLGVDTVAALNTLEDNVEFQAPYLLLLDHEAGHAALLNDLAARAGRLAVHVVVLADLAPDLPSTPPGYTVAADGQVTAGTGDVTTPRPARLSTLGDGELADVLDLVRAAAPRPEPGFDIEAPQPAPPRQTADQPHLSTPDVPTTTSAPPVRLDVLGPVTVTVEHTEMTSLRSGSLSLLALLAAHPSGLTTAQIVDVTHSDLDPGTAAARVHTAIHAVRTLLGQATARGATSGAVLHEADEDGGRYRLDPDLFDVDLWRMWTALRQANSANDDQACLAALRAAIAAYGGDFAAGTDIWCIGYATTIRHQFLSACARAAELLEPDQPDRALALLEHAVDQDPVNEELYQRIIRLHGQADCADEVRATVRKLENRLYDLGESEPSAGTRRLAARYTRSRPAMSAP